MTSSMIPPEYAARMPSVAASVVASSAADDAEDQRAARAEDDLREDVAALVGRAEEVVPRRRLLRRGEVEAGRVVDGDPRRDHRDDDHEGEERQAEARLRVGEEQGEPAGDAVMLPAARRRRAGAPAARWQAGAATSAGPHPRVEDEVEQVHDEVRGDHAEREDEQQALGQRVVVAEHRLLQRQARAGVAEDELDEDDAADGAVRTARRSRSAAAGSRCGRRSGSSRAGRAGPWRAPSRRSPR